MGALCKTNYTKNNQLWVNKYRVIAKLKDNTYRQCFLYVVLRNVETMYLELYQGFNNEFFEYDLKKFKLIDDTLYDNEDAELKMQEYISKCKDIIKYKIELVARNGKEL